MKVTREKIEDCQAFLTIEMEPAEVEESLEKSYSRLVKKTNVPGFRKGKAPRAMLERHIGKESLFEEALNHLLPEAYEMAIKEVDIEAFARTSIEVAQNDHLVFKATVPLPPTIKLGDYHQVKVTPEPVEVTEDNISAVVEQLRHQHATWEPVERPLGLNDLVVLDIESDIEDKPFINRKGIQYQVLCDQSFPAPGFAEQLVGMKGGEEKEFKLQFPADYPREELAGKEVLARGVVGLSYQEPQVSQLGNLLSRGRWFRKDERQVILLSDRLARSLGISLKQAEKATVSFWGMDSCGAIWFATAWELPSGPYWTE